MAGNTPPDDDTDEQRLNNVSFASSGHLHLVLTVTLFFVDLAMLVVAFLLSYQARNVLTLFERPLNPPALERYYPTLVLHVALVLLVFYASQLYHQPRVFSRIDHIRRIVAAVTLGAMLAYGSQGLVFKTTPFEVDYPRSMFFYAWIFSAILVTLGREAHRLIRYRLRQMGIDRENLLIVGTGKVARDIMQRIRSNPDLGYAIVGVISGRTKGKNNLSGVPVIGTYADIPDVIDSCAVEQVIIALPDAQRSELIDLITLCQRGQVDIKVYPDMFAYMAGDLNVDDLGGTPLITVRDIALRGWKLSLKRGLDICGSAVGLVLFSPLMLLTALLIRIESPGAIFHIQERMGLDGRPFPMIKFRSMRIDAESTGPGWTVENDPRRTTIGKIMRRTNWDEMPQLINVLLGHMSLVGPRPERPVYVQEFREQIPRYMERHREKAGMTGWAQVNGLRGDTSIAERTSFDLWYVENWSLWLDIQIILRTLLMIVLRRDKNAY